MWNQVTKIANIFLLLLYQILLLLKFSPQMSNTYKELCINVLFVCNKYVVYKSDV
jgi:hypothetical protein